MLTQQQQDHFETFGFAILSQVFSPQEMERISAAANALWEEELKQNPDASDIGLAPFLELSPALDWLATDDRIYSAMEQLLGRGFVWSGSEGNAALSPAESHDWHADRPYSRELGYPRIKIMLYLSPMKKEKGALRVIPGSHRDPLHTQLKPFQDVHGNKDPLFFGMPGAEVPCYALETQPGDAAVFSQSLFHGVYGKRPDRRYVALKYATRPGTDAHLASLHHFAPYAFQSYGSFADSDNPRIRGMIDPLLEQSEKAATLAKKYYP